MSEQMMPEMKKVNKDPRETLGVTTTKEIALYHQAFMIVIFFRGQQQVRHLRI